MSCLLRLPILFLLVFFCWAAPGRAATDDFCGLGVHAAHHGCACHSHSLCVCHSDGGEAALRPPLRETLPIVLAYLELYAVDSPLLPEPRLRPSRLQAPCCWSEPPGLRPPRL